MLISLSLHVNYTNVRIGEVEFCNGALKDKLVSRVATALVLYPRFLHHVFYVITFAPVSQAGSGGGVGATESWREGEIWCQNETSSAHLLPTRHGGS